VAAVVEISNRIKPYPKGRRAREVPLSAGLVAALTERRARTAKTCGVEHVAGICWSGLVVITETGRPLRNSNWSPVWRDALERAGVGHARIHDLRHTYASRLLQRGISIEDVGMLLGHVSTQTTVKYRHLAEPPSEAIQLALAAPRKPTVVRPNSRVEREGR